MDVGWHMLRATGKCISPFYEVLLPAVHGPIGKVLRKGYLEVLKDESEEHPPRKAFCPVTLHGPCRIPGCEGTKWDVCGMMWHRGYELLEACFDFALGWDLLVLVLLRKEIKIFF